MLHAPKNAFWYRLLEHCARLLGGWFLTCFARTVAAGYFFCSPKKQESLRFYAKLFPDKSAPGRQIAVFRQYQRFTAIHCDRFRACWPERIRFASKGLEQLAPCLRERGALLLMSHQGNWERLC